MAECKIELFESAGNAKRVGMRFGDSRGQWHPVSVRTTKSKRGISLAVSASGEIKLRAPEHVSPARIEQFVRANKEWLDDEINKALQSKLDMRGKLLLRGEFLQILRSEGRPRIDLIRLDGETETLLNSNDLIAPNYDASEEEFRISTEYAIKIQSLSHSNPQHMLETWLDEQAKIYLSDCLEQFWPIFVQRGHKNKPVIRTRRMRSRWGSLSLARKDQPYMSLNTALVQTPSAKVVVAHELCHLEQQNHQKPFYDLLSEIYPNWRAEEAELQKYIHALQPIADIS